MMPFLENVTRGPGHPAGAARGGRRALPALRRPQPDQRPEPRPAGRAARRARRPRARPPAAAGATGTGTRTWSTPCGRPQRRTGRAGCASSSPAPTPATPAAGSTARTSPRRCSTLAAEGGAGWRSTRSGTTSTTPASSPRSSTPSRRRWPSCRSRPATGPARVRHALGADRDERRRRARRRRRLRGASTADVRRRSPPRRSGRGAARAGVGPRLLLALRAARRSRGSSPTSTTTSRRCTRPASPGVVVVPIGFVSDHMEVVFDLDTEARADRRASSGCRSCGPPPSGTDPRFVAGLVDLVARARRRRPAARAPTSRRPGRLGPSHGGLPGRAAAATCGPTGRRPAGRTGRAPRPR